MSEMHKMNTTLKKLVIRREPETTKERNDNQEQMTGNMTGGGFFKTFVDCFKTKTTLITLFISLSLLFVFQYLVWGQ